ncbi:uncharacterized protein LOC134100070 [Sardina pilchardus]|uniref:uncharacterized protein LOC134100070 n=1 Tax=Sardina pilchardus TaxID=27697 RepID=UPI002E143941
MKGSDERHLYPTVNERHSTAASYEKDGYPLGTGTGGGPVPGTLGVNQFGAGQGGGKPPKPGYGSLGAGYPQQGGVPQVPGGGYGGYPQAYPGYGAGQLPQQGYGAGQPQQGYGGLSPQQAKAAKYGIQGFYGAGYRGGAGCQGKYCGRRRK